MKKIIFYMWCMLCFIPAARADIENEYAVIHCNKELNFLKISAGTINGSVAQEAFKDKKEKIYKKYGFVIYEDLFEFGPDYKWQLPKEFSDTCVLQSTTYKGKKPEPILYKVTLKGKSETANPNGYCGGWRSFTATIEQGDKVLVKDVSFAEKCNDGRALWDIEINPQEGYLTIGALHKMKIDMLTWLDRPFETITDEMVYPPGQTEADF